MEKIELTEFVRQNEKMNSRLITDWNKDMLLEAMQMYARLYRLSNSFIVTDKDIATIEALHDLLLDGEGYPLNHPSLKRSRELTQRMYKALGQNEQLN